MASNDQVLLKDTVSRNKAELELQLTDSEYFERFTAEQILKDFDLPDDLVEAGIVGGSNDGGIDSIFILVNEEVVSLDTDVTEFKKNSKMDLFVIQSKFSTGFKDRVIDNFTSFTDDLLDFSKNLTDMRKQYNSQLIQIVEKFRETYLSVRPKSLYLNYFYSSLGDTKTLNDSSKWKTEKLKMTVMRLFSGCEFRCEFLGATELLLQTRKLPTKKLDLHLLENAMSTTFENSQGYLCLVSLEKYYQFIANDEDRTMRKYVFDANIRDYLGKVEVNEGIQKSLTSASREDFWWLNNGITIIATKGTIVGKTITLEDPQIVNGLQTSTEIYNYFSSNIRIKDDRSILVRVIVTEDATSRDKIIRATNSQNLIPPAFLRATDKIQRDIEDYFLLRGGLFYDRRKNYYKNHGSPRDKIIGIPYLSQAITAIALRRPDLSRSKSSGLIKRDEDYASLFNEKYPIRLYWICAKIMKQIETHMRTLQVDLDREVKNNIAFYVAMYVVLRKLGVSTYKAEEVAGIDPDTITPDFLHDCVVSVASVFGELVTEKATFLDVLAKQPETTAIMIKHFEEMKS